jgi:hypothetical protein
MSFSQNGDWAIIVRQFQGFRLAEWQRAIEDPYLGIHLGQWPLSLTMSRTTFFFERFSLTPALSRWERENGRPMI